jgi:4-hydroxybenzoate polyprenyltransferase
MNTNLIEKYDRSRINLLIGAAIGWGIYYGIFIFRDQISNEMIKGTLGLIGLVAFVFFLYSLFRILRIKRIMKRNPELKSALENEWVIQTRKKAYAIGYWVMMISVMTGLNLVLFTNISPKMILELILFVGVLSLMITFIVLNKRD